MQGREPARVRGLFGALCRDSRLPHAPRRCRCFRTPALSKSSFSKPLVCIACRRIPASSSTGQWNWKSDSVLFCGRSASRLPPPTRPPPLPLFRSDQGAGFRVQGSGFRVQGTGCRVQGSGFRVQGAGFRVQGAGFRVQGAGCRVHRPLRRMAAAPHCWIFLTAANIAKPVLCESPIPSTI